LTYPSDSEVRVQVQEAMSGLPHPSELDVGSIIDGIYESYFWGLSVEEEQAQLDLIGQAVLNRDPFPTFIGTRPFEGEFAPLMVYVSSIRFLDVKTQSVRLLLLYERGRQWQIVGLESFNAELFRIP
jgi:hypothetical protein